MKSKVIKPNPYAFFDPYIGSNFIVKFDKHESPSCKLLEVKRKKITGDKLAKLAKYTTEEGKERTSQCFSLVFEGFTLSFEESVSSPRVTFNGFIILIKQEKPMYATEEYQEYVTVHFEEV